VGSESLLQAHSKLSVKRRGKAKERGTLGKKRSALERGSVETDILRHT
jgi:hypothetical protein